MAEVDPLTNYSSTVEEGIQNQGGYDSDLSSKVLLTTSENNSVKADSCHTKIGWKTARETASKHVEMLSPLVHGQGPNFMESSLQLTGSYPSNSSPISGNLTASTSSASTGLSTHSASENKEFIAPSLAQSNLINEPRPSTHIPLLPPYNASNVFTSVSVSKDDQGSNTVSNRERDPSIPVPQCFISEVPPSTDISSPPSNTSEVVISNGDQASSTVSNKSQMSSPISLPITSASATVSNITVSLPALNSCHKCYSDLACSCPGPSGIDCDGISKAQLHGGDISGEVACPSIKVKVDDKQALCLFDGKKPKEEDVEPAMYQPVPLNRLDILFDELVEYNKIAKAEQPEAITTKLFPYQQQALNWMMIRENNDDLAPFWKQVNSNTWLNKGTGVSTDRKPVSPKGGILADDMGLGKTLVVISLIMANHLNRQPMFSRRSTKRKQGGMGESKSPQGNDEPVEKIRRKKSSSGENLYGDDNVVEQTKAGKTVTIKKKREAVDRKKRLPNSKALKEPGFKFRQMYLSQITCMSTKKEKQVVKEACKSPVLSPIIIDDDGDGELSNNVLVGPWLTASGRRDPNSTKAPLTDEPAATLIVCPLSVLSNWTDQICSHVHPDVSLQVYMYYGLERLRDVKFLNQQDIVLTTYPTLTNDYSKGDSPLHKIKWLRVILDEGHTIRNARTRLTKCMMDLTAQRRWVLTGTPIQNRLDDLWSVVTFLRLEPFDVKAWWNFALASSVRRGDEHGVNRLQQLLKHISIRRLKTDQDEGRPLVILPPRKVVIHEIELSEEERELYDAMQKHGQFIISRYLQNGTVLQKYAHCFAILMRLRQLCLHPELCAEECENLKQARKVLQGLDDSDDDDDLDVDHETQRLIKDLLASLSSGVDEECSVCLDSLVDPMITRCAHVFCQQCIMDVISSEDLSPLCPLCRAPVNQNELIKVPEKKKPKEHKTTVESNETCKKSSKLDALIASLCAIRDKDPSIKSLVVSQFTSFLDQIEAALEKENFPFVRLDGRMIQEARAQAIENFSDPSSSSPKVFLLSLSAGGVGLNLTAATRVFLMDPAWNPAIEEQCFDRSHRLGQTKEVIITKYIVMDSVEERMLSLQEKKRKLMGQAFGLHQQSEEDRRRARVRDIRHLIGL